MCITIFTFLLHLGLTLNTKNSFDSFRFEIASPLATKSYLRLLKAIFAPAFATGEAMVKPIP